MKMHVTWDWQRRRWAETARRRRWYYYRGFSFGQRNDHWNYDRD